MTIIQSIFLGIIQGITELLPVSSSGHLTLLQQYLHIESTPLFYDIFLHFATLIAICWFFREAILNIKQHRVIQLALASLPTLVIGFLFKDFLLSAFNSTLVVGIGLLFTAGFNFSTELILKKNELLAPKEMKTHQSFYVGLWQTLALVPGVSRSGTTMFSALLTGVNKKEALEFSSLLSIPVILAVTAAEFLDHQHYSIVLENVPIYLVGAITAFFTSLLSLKLLCKLLDNKKFDWFGWYCLVIGCLVVIENLFI